MSNIKIKTPEEIQGIHKSCQLAARCLDFIESEVKPGVSTGELDRKLEEYIRDHDAIPAPLDYHGFPKATCISVNEVVCHGIPSDDQILNEGDIVNIDVTTILDGYYGDTSRMYAVGKIPLSSKYLLEHTQTALAIGIKQVAPGRHFGDIGYAISFYAKAYDLGVVEQFCGHGTGLEFHEPPQVPHFGKKGAGEVMQPGMVFTIEPMLNLGTKECIINEADGWTATTKDGKRSAQYEHTVAVTSHGCRILTHFNLADWIKSEKT